jgi:hypothetical protein
MPFDFPNALQIVISGQRCAESDSPYDIEKSADKPSQQCYDDTRRCEAVAYRRLVSTNLNQLTGCLASDIRSSSASADLTVRKRPGGPDRPSGPAEPAEES